MDTGSRYIRFRGTRAFQFISFRYRYISRCRLLPLNRSIPDTVASDCAILAQLRFKRITSLLLRRTRSRCRLLPDPLLSPLSALPVASIRHGNSRC